LKLFQEWGRGMKENKEGANSRMTYLIYFKNVYKCHNVLPFSTTIKKNTCMG
jgi:hypothetical protein